MFFVADSKNAKIGTAAATYAPIKQTCPDTCPLKANGCYAQGGNVGMHVRRIEAFTDGLNGDTAAMLEGAEIADNAMLSKDLRPLRIHVSGDATTDYRASRISAGAAHWPGRVWSYTHAWREVARASWRKVSVLASCESTSQAKEAMAKGYAAALVTGPHPSAKAYVKDGVKIVPCPSQTRNVKCTDCRLCFDDAALLKRAAVIAFAAHGAITKRALTVVQ